MFSMEESNAKLEAGQQPASSSSMNMPCSATTYMQRLSAKSTFPSRCQHAVSHGPALQVALCFSSPGLRTASSPFRLPEAAENMMPWTYQTQSMYMSLCYMPSIATRVCCQGVLADPVLKEGLAMINTSSRPCQQTVRGRRIASLVGFSHAMAHMPDHRLHERGVELEPGASRSFCGHC